MNRASRYACFASGFRRSTQMFIFRYHTRQALSRSKFVQLNIATFTVGLAKDPTTDTNVRGWLWPGLHYNWCAVTWGDIECTNTWNCKSGCGFGSAAYTEHHVLVQPFLIGPTNLPGCLSLKACIADVRVWQWQVFESESSEVRCVFMPLATKTAIALCTP